MEKLFELAKNYIMQINLTAFKINKPFLFRLAADVAKIVSLFIILGSKKAKPETDKFNQHKRFPQKNK